MPRRTSATIIWRNWSSPDSVSSNRNVLVPLAAEEVQALIQTYTELHGHTGRAFGPNDPQRAWWPDSPPPSFRKAFLRLAKVTVPDDPGFPGLVETLANGEWFYFTSVPALLQDAMRALAVETPNSASVKTDDLGLGDEWAGFFRFLARLGITVRVLPGRNSYSEPTVHTSEVSGVIDLLDFDQITRINVAESPFPVKK